MRAALLLVIVAILALLAAFASGWISLNQTRPATTPSVQARDGAVTVTPGQSPKFEIETGSLSVGTKPSNVAVPQVTVGPSNTTVPVPTVTATKPAGTQPAN